MYLYYNIVLVRCLRFYVFLFVIVLILWTVNCFLALYLQDILFVFESKLLDVL